MTNIPLCEKDILNNYTTEVLKFIFPNKNFLTYFWVRLREGEMVGLVDS